jgi:hypothetical protein
VRFKDRLYAGIQDYDGRTIDRDRVGRLRVTDDGDTWREISLPPEAGRPSDITRFRGSLVVLTERQRFRLHGWKLTAVTERSDRSDKKAPFVVNDYFCAPPLAVFRNELYAGGQRDGAIFRLAQ